MTAVTITVAKPAQDNCVTSADFKVLPIASIANPAAKATPGIVHKIARQNIWARLDLFPDRFTATT